MLVSASFSTLLTHIQITTHTHTHTHTHARTQLWIYTIPAGLFAAITLVAFWWSQPPIPPAPSAGKDDLPFLRGVWKVPHFTTPPYRDNEPQYRASVSGRHNSHAPNTCTKPVIELERGLVNATPVLNG